MTSTTLDQLPLSETLSPADEAALAEVVRQSYEQGVLIYPIGGGTSLDYGLPAREEGLGLSLEALDRVIDYPARDMTITVEAGVRMADLAAELAGQRQCLPIDVAQDSAATLGGIIASNWSGPRRYGSGTMRDYVIGIRAVDGRGVPFAAGGRVVKNVAGYDFCKLLTGSLGTLGVITQVTLKVRPLPQRRELWITDVASSQAAEAALESLVTSPITPSIVELLVGDAWQTAPGLADSPARGCGRLLLGLEGTADEVDWMSGVLRESWQQQGLVAAPIAADQIDPLLSDITGFAAADKSAAVIKANLRPSAVTRFIEALRSLAPQASLHAQAGNGIVTVRLSGVAPAALSQLLLQQLQPVAHEAEGNVVLVSSPEGAELTRQTVWGGAADSARVMRAVKQQFDPKDLLNRGRFVY